MKVKSPYRGFRLPRDLVDLVEEIAKADRRSTTNLIHYVLVAYLRTQGVHYEQQPPS